MATLNSTTKLLQLTTHYVSLHHKLSITLRSPSRLNLLYFILLYSYLLFYYYLFLSYVYIYVIIQWENMVGKYSSINQVLTLCHF